MQRKSKFGTYRSRPLGGPHDAVADCKLPLAKLEQMAGVLLSSIRASRAAGAPSTRPRDEPRAPPSPTLVGSDTRNRGRLHADIWSGTAGDPEP